MFFIFGIAGQQKALDFDQTIICPVCGRFGHLQIIMTCTCFSLFFLPVFRWGRRYHAVMGCCGASCELDLETGRRIARGEIHTLDPSTLHFAGNGRGNRRCSCCGYETAEDFAFCPKCGAQF